MFNIRVDEFEMNENQHSMSIRDKIERQKNYSKKRKAEEDLNQNKNIKKSRNRFVNFISLKRELKMKKSTNRAAIDRRVKSLKTTKEYINASVEDQQQMIQKNKNEIIIKR
jgi:IMP dehydrogenase/GMP reductase